MYRMLWILSVITLISVMMPLHAVTISCPSVTEIKNHQFKTWLPLYIEGEELASQNDVTQFIHDVTEFKAARWSWWYLESGHCFYAGFDMTKKIILAHDTGRPVDTNNWHWIEPNRLAECVISPTECQFLI